MKVRAALIILALALTQCKRSSLFTEIDANFKSLDDVFISEFKNQTRHVERNSELSLDAKEALTGNFGTLLSLDVWEFASEADARQAYETLTGIEKQNGPREYDQTRAKEYRYTYVRATGVAGEIFTVKKVLFRFIGESKDTIREYLIASKLGRVR